MLSPLLKMTHYCPESQKGVFFSPLQKIKSKMCTNTFYFHLHEAKLFADFSLYKVGWCKLHREKIHTLQLMWLSLEMQMCCPVIRMPLEWLFTLPVLINRFLITFMYFGYKNVIKNEDRSLFKRLKKSELGSKSSSVYSTGKAGIIQNRNKLTKSCAKECYGVALFTVLRLKQCFTLR